MTRTDGLTDEPVRQGQSTSKQRVARLPVAIPLNPQPDRSQDPVLRLENANPRRRSGFTRSIHRQHLFIRKGARHLKNAFRQWVSFNISLILHAILMIALALITLPALNRERQNLQITLEDTNSESMPEWATQVEVEGPPKVTFESLEPVAPASLIQIVPPEMDVPLPDTVTQLDASVSVVSPLDVEVAAPIVGDVDLLVELPDADLIREFDRRVSREGGRGGSIQISLMWNNVNDLDLHVVCPSGEMIFFEAKTSRCGGILDVDMNVNGRALSEQPVENVFWNRGSAPRGTYSIFVNYYGNNGAHGPNSYAIALRIDNQPVRFFRGRLRYVNTPRLIDRFYYR